MEGFLTYDGGTWNTEKELPAVCVIQKGLVFSFTYSVGIWIVIFYCGLFWSIDISNPCQVIE